MLNALYELQTEDGAIITVNNRVLLDKRADGSPYAFSSLDIIAPEGRHEWLNHLVFVGRSTAWRRNPKCSSGSIAWHDGSPDYRAA